MTTKELYSGVLNGLQYIATALQTEQVFQIIQLCLSILTTLILLIFKIISWVKAAKADGKIEQQEIEQVIGTITEDATKIKDDVGKISDIVGKDKEDNG